LSASNDLSKIVTISLLQYMPSRHLISSPQPRDVPYLLPSFIVDEEDTGDNGTEREPTRSEDIIRPTKLWPNIAREYASSSASISDSERNEDGELERCGRSGPSCQTIVPPFFFHLPRALTEPVRFVWPSQLAYSKTRVSFPSVLNLTDFGVNRPVLRSSPSNEARPKRGEFGTDGFFKEGRSITKDEFDEEGVEQDDDESSVVATEDAEGVSIVKAGAFAEDAFIVSQSEREAASISMWRGTAG